MIRRLWHKLPHARSLEERNIALLYGEVIMAAVLAAASAFNATYILRWGGSASLVGLLASIPALVAVFLFMPAARLLERQASYRALVIWSLFAARIGYLFIALLPFVTSLGVPEATVAILIAMSAPSVLFSTGWSPLLADVVPERMRANVFAWRSILSSGTIAVLTFVVGRALDRGTFPGNYQWLYGIGLLGGILSTALVARVRIPDAHPAEIPLLHRPVSMRQGVREALSGEPLVSPLDREHVPVQPRRVDDRPAVHYLFRDRAGRRR
jgi:hypothetical protein